MKDTRNVFYIIFKRFLLQECHQLLPAMLYSDKGIKDTDMNVWKYIYIQFFKICIFRRIPVQHFR